MFTKLAEVERRCEEIDRQLADPEVLGDRQRYRELMIERGTVGPIVEKYREYQQLRLRQDESRALLEEGDAELRSLAQEELVELAAQLQAIERELRVLLTPRDPNDDKNTFLEIRGGTGGEEAALFAAELFRMYCRFAEGRRWRIEVMSQTATGIGGLREVIALVEGHGAYSVLKYEAGVHRVQRVPVTEGSGRIHTSAVTVAVLPEAEEVEIDIKPEELRIDVFRSSGPGRPERQHDRLRGAHHPPAHRPGRLLPGREIAAQEQGQGPAHPAGAAQGPARGGGGGEARLGAQGHGRHRGPQRADPDLQLPAEPRDRSPHRPHHLPARELHGGRHPGDDRRARGPLPVARPERGRRVTGSVAEAVDRGRARLAAAGIEAARLEAARAVRARRRLRPGRAARPGARAGGRRARRGGTSVCSGERRAAHAAGVRHRRARVLVAAPAGRPPGPGAAPRDRDARRGRARAPRPRRAGGRCRHRLGRDRDRPGARAAPAARSSAPTAARPPSRSRARTPPSTGWPAEIEFLEGDLLAPLAGAPGPLDALVSNPPYIPTAEIDGLQPEVRDFEPRAALDGGPDGLALIARIIAGAPPLLRRGGWLLLEIGAGQAERGARAAAARGPLRATSRPGATSPASSGWSRRGGPPDAAAMESITIAGGPRLRGTVRVGGAKNAALPILAATILVPGEHRVRNVPRLRDVDTMARLLEILGAKVERRGDEMVVETGALSGEEAPYDLVKTMRASVLVLGPLLARAGQARVSLPGGCAIGERPVNLHLAAMRALGAEIAIEHGYISASAGRLRGARIHFEKQTVTGTENALMAAVTAEGSTEITNAACEPEIADLAQALAGMGARIFGAGTATIVVHGVERLRPIDHAVMPDRIEAGTLMLAAAMTRGDVLVEGADPSHLARGARQAARGRRAGGRDARGRPGRGAGAPARGRHQDRPLPGVPDRHAGPVHGAARGLARPGRHPRDHFREPLRPRRRAQAPRRRHHARRQPRDRAREGDAVGRARDGHRPAGERVPGAGGAARRGRDRRRPRLSPRPRLRAARREARRHRRPHRTHQGAV